MRKVDRSKFADGSPKPSCLPLVVAQSGILLAGQRQGSRGPRWCPGRHPAFTTWENLTPADPPLASLPWYMFTLLSKASAGFPDSSHRAPRRRRNNTLTSPWSVWYLDQAPLSPESSVPFHKEALPLPSVMRERNEGSKRQATPPWACDTWCVVVHLKRRNNCREESSWISRSNFHTKISNITGRDSCLGCLERRGWHRSNRDGDHRRRSGNGPE